MATKVTVAAKSARAYRWSELASLPDQTVVSVDDSGDSGHLRIVTRRTGNHVAFHSDTVAQVNEKYYVARGHVRFRVTNETCFVEFR